jgi:hypothetical protein
MSLNASTLNGGVNAQDNYVRLASGTGAEVGKLLQVDSETMKVLDVSLSPVLRVARGQSGTASVAHTTGARTVLGLAADFPVRPAPAEYHYAAAGAIDPKPGLHKLKTGTAGAMTLRDPLASEEGVEFEVVALDAQAYTLTYTAGFASDTTGSDVATWDGEIGSSMRIKCVDGVWKHFNLQGVTVA